MVQDTKPQLLTPALCRAARGLLDWTQADLAGRAEVSRGTIRDYEGGHHGMHRASTAQVKRALEDAGIIFIVIDDLVAVALRPSPVTGDAAAAGPAEAPAVR